MKRERVVYFGLALALSMVLAGCGGTTTPAPTTAPAETQPVAQGETQGQPQDSNEMPEASAVAANPNDPASILAAMQADFDATAQGLLDEQAALFAQIGESYDGYAANVGAVQAWYDLAVSESEALGARTIENARQYYRAVVATVDHGDDDALDDAMEDLYDLIYDDAFDEFYDVIYDDAFDDMYDQLYDGVIADAYDTLEYDEWYDAHSDAYEAWFDSKSDVYDAWFDSKSDVYDEWFDVKSDFYSGEFDIDETLRLNE